MIPRIRGRAGQASEPEEVKGKWFFEIVVATLLGEQIGEPIGPYGPFETEAECKREMRKACRLGCEAVEERFTGKKSGKYFDMKEQQLRSWDEN